MTWIEVENHDDIDNLMSIFGRLHDSCIKEMHFLGRGYVDSGLSMGLNKNDRLRIIFQRQWENPSVIELEFDGILSLSMDIN